MNLFRLFILNDTPQFIGMKKFILIFPEESVEMATKHWERIVVISCLA